MSDQLMTYEVGTRVWCNVLNWIWWPGKIINLEDTPEEFQEYVADKKKKRIAVVIFETDNTHEAVINKKNLMLYNCSKKLAFLEKGYALYVKQLKGGNMRGFKMNNFLKDAKLAELATGGNENIFEQFVKKYESIQPKLNISALFISTKDKFKKRKLAKQTHLVKDAKKTKTVSNSLQSGESSVEVPHTPTTTTKDVFYCNSVCGKNGCSYKSVNRERLRLHITKQDSKKKVINKTLAPKPKRSAVLKGQASSSNSSTEKQPQTTKSPKMSKISSGKKTRSQNNIDILNDLEENSNDNNLGESSGLGRTMEAINFQSPCKNCIMAKLNNTRDQNLVLSSLKSSEEETEANVKNQTCIEDPITADMSTISDKDNPPKLGCFKLFQLAASFTPDWMKDEKWDTLENTQYNEAKNAWATSLGNLPDLSNMKLENALKPVIPHPSDSLLLNNEFEIDILPEEPKPEPGFERRTMLIPVDTSAKDKVKTDDELLKDPFIQEVLKKIKDCEYGDVSIEFPGAVLLPKDDE